MGKSTDMSQETVNMQPGSLHRFLKHVLVMEGLVSAAFLDEVDANFDALDADHSGELTQDDINIFTAKLRGSKTDMAATRTSS
mmetsp:Transcript_43867/g.98692  ORF Transcript_43867/g.98692 Transcript_43867/m.98692 type:complete len:83 (+) Transcript_43867:794-1042(+)